MDRQPARHRRAGRCPRAGRPGVPRAGAVGVPPAHGGGEHPGGARAAGAAGRGAPSADGPAPGRVRPRDGAPATGVDALRRGAPQGRDRPGALARADIPLARRAVHRDRSAVGAGAPADGPLPPGAGARPRDHRPQRPRHARHHRSRRDHPRRPDPVVRQTRGAPPERGGPPPVPRRGVPAVRLSLLDRLLSTEVGISFGFGLGFFSTLLLMNHVFYLARLAISQGMPFGVALELFVYKVPYLVAFSAPMGVLLATVLGVGRMTDHNEIAALRVCGSSLYRIAAPVVLLGCVAAVGIVVFAEGIVSIANDRYRSVFNDFMTRAPELQPVENVFFQGPSAEGTALYHARRYDPRTRTLESVTVIYLTGGETLRVIQAHEATYRAGGAWTFHDGGVYGREQGRGLTTRFRS